METLLQDVRYAVRSWRRAPAFIVVAVFTLALGIGGTTAVYSFVSGILLKPLPYHDPDRIVVITRSLKKQGLRGLLVPSKEVAAFRQESQVFLVVSGLEYRAVTLSGDERPERAMAAGVLPDLLPLLGIEPGLGRSFLPEDFEPGRETTTILSHRLWQSRFGGDTGVLGRHVRIDGKDHVVVGVLPQGMEIPLRSVDLLTPLSLDVLDRTSEHAFRVFARLKTGFSVQVAGEEANAIVHRIEQENPPPVTGWGADVLPLAREIVGEVEPTLLVLLGAVGLVLLIACANVANLFLTRGAIRGKEMAIRSAIGAPRRRIMRQLLTESLLLSLAGGALGALIAAGGTRLLLALVPSNTPRLSEVGIDFRVLGFALAVSVATGILSGLFPAIGISKPDLDRFLRAAERATTSGLSQRRVLGLLTVTEVALALTLSIGAGLMIDSLMRLLSIDLGFKAGGVLTLQISLPEYRYTEPSEKTVVVREILDRVKALPGVESVAGSSWTPMTGSWARAQASVEDRSGSVQERERWAMVLSVTPGYFGTLGIPTLQGRDFNEEDRPQISRVAIVNQSFAQKAWPDGNVIGKRLKFGGPMSQNPWLTVVGVVADARLVGLAKAGEEGFFLPYLNAEHSIPSLQMVVRTSSDPLAALPSIRASVEQVDADLPMDDVSTMAQLVARNLSQPRFNLLVIGVFAVVAMSLAAVGVYGVISHAVAERDREIGLRVALGASSRDVLKLVVGQGMAFVLLGVALGVACAFAVTRLLTAFLYEVSATDATAFASASLVVGGIGLLATFFPAWRATRIDPVSTLRAE